MRKLLLRAKAQLRNLNKKPVNPSPVLLITKIIGFRLGTL